MAKNDSEDGCATVIGGGVIGIIVLISMIPKQVWIGLGVAVGLVFACWVLFKGIEAFEEARKAATQRRRATKAAEAAAVERRRIEAAREAERRLIALIGEKNALVVQSARASVQRVAESEAAQAGWLGDVDFTADIHGITENFRKAYGLRKVAAELSALANPSVDDKRILVEAKATADGLEFAAIERAGLIAKCSAEAALVDKSLRAEREEARTAEQRAALHAKLSGMLYGIEATPASSPADSTADAVMARVQAYREIKNQIQLARGEAS